MRIKLALKGSQLTLEYVANSLPHDKFAIPEEIKEVLLKTEQSVTANVSLGTAPIELWDRGEG